MKFQNRLSNWVIIVITAIAIYVVIKSNYWNQKDKVISWDIICYYSYLPATFIYHDVTLGFVDFNKSDKYIFWFGTAPTGAKYIKTTMGMAILYAPFFFLGHLGAYLFDYDTGGFSEPYKMALVFSCIFYLWLGLFFLKRTLVKFFSESITVLVIIIIVFGTNLFNYSTFDAPMPHTYCFALFAIFVFLTQKWYDIPSVKNSIFIGLLSGIISLVRPTNIVIALFFIFYKVSSLQEVKSRIMFYKTKFINLILILFFAFIIWIPQILYWKKITGNFFFFSYGEEGFFFTNPQIIRGLFSYQNGWLVYAPVMLFALIGIPFLYRYAKAFFLPVLFFTLINIYVILSWWCWWYTGFGNRAMIDSYAILAIPLAAFATWTSLQQKFIARIALFILIGFAFFQGVFHSLQFHNGSIHYNSMTKEAYLVSFWKVGPTNEFWYKLREPDYDSALVGVHSYLDERNDSLQIYFNLEEIQNNGKSITDSTLTYKIESTDSISNITSRSGKNSIYVYKDNPYGLGLAFRVFNNEKYRVSVWRKKTEVKSYLVISSNQDPNYSISESKAIISDGQWEKIQLEFQIIPSIHNTLIKIFVMNENPEKVFFDDLRVERIH
jgi:hypothetical protein